MIPIPLMIKIALAIIAALFLAKTLAPSIGQMIWDLIYKPKKKKNSDLDFDFLIEQKKSMLRSGQGSSSGRAIGASSQKNRTEELIHENYKKLSSKAKRTDKQEGQYKDLKLIIGLLDSTQWGGGGKFKELASLLTNKLAKRVSEEDINLNFQSLLKRETLITPQNDILDYESIKVILETKIFFQFLLSDETLLKSLAKRYSTGHEEVKKGMAVYFKKAQRKDSPKLQITILKNPSPQLPPEDSAFIFSLLKDKKGTPIRRIEILAAIKEEVEFFKALSPLPKLKNKNDVEGAFNILGLKKGTPFEQIKKQYKSLAKLKHPDRLKGKGIPSNFESIATENFTRIQEAYDILSNDNKN